MSKEIVIVTAFFDINRESFEVYQRSKKQYFDYFKFWARIKNRMIVYCEKKDFETIRVIRSDFGLIDKTEIIIIEDIYQIEPAIFKQMNRVSEKKEFKNSRYYSVALSNRADYDYVMLLKYWCLFNASKQMGEDVNLAWIDFGFNHGGKFYTNPDDFSFTWEYDFKNKVTVFCLSDPNNMIGIDSLLFQKDCIMGAPFIVQSSFAIIFWEEIRMAMNALLSLDCIDDDQQLLLMVFKLHKDWFDVIISDWFEAFIICSSHCFSTIEKKAPKSSIKKEDSVLNDRKKQLLVFRVCRKLRCLVKRFFRKNKKNNHQMQISKSREFAERMYQKAKNYYGS